MPNKVSLGYRGPERFWQQLKDLKEIKETKQFLVGWGRGRCYFRFIPPESSRLDYKEDRVPSNVCWKLKDFGKHN